MPWVQEEKSAESLPAENKIVSAVSLVSKWKSAARNSKINIEDGSNAADASPASAGHPQKKALDEADRNGVNAESADTNHESEKGVSLWKKAKVVTKSNFVFGRQWQSARKRLSATIQDRVEMHHAALQENRPEVAFLLPADIDLPKSLRLCATASLRFHGVPARLFVVQLETSRDGDTGKLKEERPSEQLMQIEKELQRLSDMYEERGEKLYAGDTQPWPLHERRVSQALLARESEVLALESGAWAGYCGCGILNRILHALRIFSPDENGPVLQAFREQYGPSAAFASVWGFFYVQALWILFPLIILILILQCKPAANGTDRIKFEIVKGGVIIWGAAIAVLCSTRFLGDYAVKEMKRRRLKEQRCSDLIMKSSKMSKMPLMKRRLIMIFVAVPLLLLLASFCLFTLVGITNLVLHIIYVWGDCYNLHKPCPDPTKPLDCKDICRDAEKKHNKLGWAAEVSCDIALALLFELFFSLSTALSGFVSELFSFEYENDRRYFKSMLEVSLSALERIGFVFSLAFFFVPQWSEPQAENNTIDMSIDCSDLWLGDSSYWCYQKRLPLELRRSLLEKLMKGPFIVAPFIAILIKTIIPYVVYKLSQACDYLIRCPCTCFPLLPFRVLLRFFTLIFTLEGDNVGCFKFVCKGWPFSHVTADPAPDGSDKEPLQEYKKGVFSVLDQAVLKPFEADDELMELEMSFLWILFFTPLRAEGVIATLIAKVIEIYFDWFKMLHVRRRSFPIHDKVMRREQTSFVNAVVLASVGWTIGLSLITYNDHLHEWGSAGTAVFVIMILWLFFCAILGFSKFMSMGCALGYARFVVRPEETLT